MDAPSPQPPRALDKVAINYISEQIVPRATYLCDGERCHQRIEDAQPWWRCTRCDNARVIFRVFLTLDQFDLCPSCATKGLHPHPLYKEKHHPTDVMYTVQSKNTMAEKLLALFTGFEERPCIAERIVQADNSLGDYHYYSYGEIWTWCRHLGSALIDGLEAALGPLAAPVPPAHAPVVGIQLDVQKEYYIADYACLSHGLVSCPMVITLALDALDFVVRHTAMAAILIHAHRAIELAPLLAKNTSLRIMVVVPQFGARRDGVEAAKAAVVKLKAALPSVSVHLYEEFIARPATLRPLRPRALNELSTLSCTSGSTGEPKLCMMMEEQTCRKAEGHSVSSTRMFCYWTETIYDRWNDIRCFASGGRVACYGGDLNSMLEEVRLVEPSSVSFAPRIWNQLQAEYMQAVRERPYAEDEIVERFAGLFGKRLRLVVTGGAATSNSVLQWLYKVWGRRCAVSDSYGITEAGGLAYDGDRKDSVQMKLEDWEEYRSTDLPLPRGELLVRTPAMFAGYYGQADATKEALTSDGFFRTGDIVEATVNGHGRISRVKVIGRRKALFKLAQGEYVSPEVIEGIFGECPLCAQVYIHGEALASCVWAVIVPNFSHLREQLKAQGLSVADSSNEVLCANPTVVGLYRSELRMLALKRRLRAWEIPRRILLESCEWTLKNGMVTATQKLRRAALAVRYGAALASLSDGEVTSDSAAFDQLVRDAVGKEGVLDSVSAIRLAATLRSVLDVEMDAATLVGANIAALPQAIAATVSAPAEARVAAEPLDWEWEVESELPPTFPAKLKHAASDAHKMPLFITGATGFVGRNVLRCLNALPKKLDVYCLVRADSAAAASHRLAAALGVSTLPLNVRALPGDLTKPRLGLSDEDYNEVQQNAGQILHCGAQVNHLMLYAQLRPANVDSTREILLLAATAPARALVVHYVSTSGVFHHARVARPDESNTFTEQTVLMPSPRLKYDAGYNQSKWVADHMVERARARGLEGVTFRPGFVGANSVTGESNLTDTDSRIIVGILMLGRAPDAPSSPLDSTPVDWLASAIVEMMLNPAPLFALHFKHPNGPTTLGAILGAARTRGYAVVEEPFRKWVQSVREITDKTNPLYGMADLYFSGARFPSRTAPPIDENWATTWIQWLEKHSTLTKVRLAAP